MGVTRSCGSTASAGFHGQQTFSVFSQEHSFYWGFQLHIRTFVGEKNEIRLFL